MTRYFMTCLWSALLVLSTPVGGGAAPVPPDSRQEVYFTPFSHLDFFWGGTREECLTRGNRIIAKAVTLAKQSSEFRFLLEDNVFVDNYQETHKGSQELEDLKRLVKEGRIEIAPKWVGIFQGLPDGEVHARNLMYGKRYARAAFGVDPQVAQLGDLPDYTPQYPQILARAGVPFMIMTRMGPADTSLFRWKSPDGSTALVWNSLKGYGWGTFVTSKTQSGEEKVQRLAKDLADLRPTTDGPVLMHWGVDLWSPPDDLVESAQALSKAGPARFIIATPSDFFRRVAKSSGIPERSGEIPSSWPNVVSSLAHMWPLAIPATNTLLTAEKFAAINYALGYADYPQPEFEFLWKKLIESMDHNHDGQGGAIGDQRKIEYSQLAILRGGEILRNMMRNIAERVRIPIPKSFPIVVFNPMSWARDDAVRAHVTLYGEVSPGDLGEFRKGVRLLDEAGTPVPFHLLEYSENISRALDLVFIARGVPSLGYKTYYLAASDRPETFSKAAEITLDSDKDRTDFRRPLGSDVLESQAYRVTVDKATGRATVFDKGLRRDVCRDMEIVAFEERGGNYIGVEPPSGRTIFNSIQEVAVEENNPVRAVVRISGEIAGIAIVQRLTLYRDLARIDVENTIEWKKPRFVRLQQLFPLTQEKPSIHYGVPFGANASDNILPNSSPRARDEITKESWMRSRHIHDWIHAGIPEWGLTIAADHQLVRIDDGVIRAEMLRGTRYTSVKVVRGDEVTSLQYPPPGMYVFRYSLSSQRGDWKAAKAYRTGMDFNNPLAPVSVADDISAKSLPPSRSFCLLGGDNLVVSALKKSDLSSRVLLRVFEIEGSAAEVPVEFLGQQRSFREVNLLEEELPAAGTRSLKVNPYEIRTITLDMGGVPAP